MKRSFLSATGSQGTTVLHKTVSYTPHPLPARQFDPDTTEPVSFYLSSLEELLAWKPTSDDDFNVATMPLADREPPLRGKSPRTLVCHDMKNGYLEDRFIQGSASRDPYVFYHWQYIDIFVYFSHHAVTIPPVTWTNAAHRNGVSVLGTFITEWTSGGKLCESFLAGEAATYHAVAVQLGRVARFYRFDGWLVNIENPLSEAAARNLPLFLRALREQLQRDVPGGLVLWYDSVVQSGALQWQNELNEKNRVFFDACDGLFTNYNWKEEHLERMGAQAGERLADVYVGIDVFARGVVVGGGFETDKVPEPGLRVGGVSVLSCARRGGTARIRLSSPCRFWGLLAELLPTHSISTLPFSTCFCLGMGTGRFSAGQEEGVRPWYNLSAQEIQPLFTAQPAPGGAGRWLRTCCSLQDAWNGGSSLLIEGSIPPAAGHVAVRLFSFQMSAPPKLFLSLVYKLEEKLPEVVVALELTTWDSGSCHVGNIAALLGPATRHQPQPLPTPPPHLSGLLSGCGRQSTAGEGPSLPGSLLLGAALESSSLPRRPWAVSKPPSPLQVLDADSLRSSLPRVPSLEASQVLWRKSPGTDQLSLSLTLRWSYPPSQARCFRIHCQGMALPLPEQPQLLGVAHATLYRVVGLAVPEAPPKESCRVEFFVEPVLNEGVAVDRSRWGRLVLVYSNPASTN
uniref:Cytosolic endo-beta-N-acetylglucosaminidase n=1 Tax=Chelydra serpentina TaxID=8475 RepID=A0A8C3SP64_CHESE